MKPGEFDINWSKKDGNPSKDRLVLNDVYLNDIVFYSNIAYLNLGQRFYLYI